MVSETKCNQLSYHHTSPSRWDLIIFSAGISTTSKPIHYATLKTITLCKFFFLHRNHKKISCQHPDYFQLKNYESFFVTLAIPSFLCVLLLTDCDSQNWETSSLLQFTPHSCILREGSCWMGNTSWDRFRSLIWCSINLAIGPCVIWPINSPPLQLIYVSTYVTLWLRPSGIYTPYVPGQIVRLSHGSAVLIPVILSL